MFENNLADVNDLSITERQNKLLPKEPSISSAESKHAFVPGTFMERAGASMEKALGSFFTAWGTCKSLFGFFFSPFVRIMYLCRWIVCARWPWLMIFLGISVAAALTAGVIFLKVTIDPVELWAAPESRSRLEKDYFDENFTPFYRTEQVILHAENYDGEHGTVSCDNRNQNKSDTDTKKTSSFFHTSLNMKRCRESKHLDRHFDLTSFW